LRDIDPCVTGSAADLVSCPNRHANRILSTPLRSIGIALAVAALCAGAAGCISDSGTSLSGASQGPSDGTTMRYYGGPKYPMWSSSQ
jgi:hypothetical protein